MPKPLFTIVLIARNEAATLPRMVASLKEFKKRGGEIIVVDTGSTDDTANIGRRLGCKVKLAGDKFIRTVTVDKARQINERWVVPPEPEVIKPGDRLFDFAAARNYAATLSRTDFLFCPDCDEIWTKFDIDAIDKAIAGGAKQFQYQFVYCHYQDGQPQVKFIHSKAYDRRVFQWKGVVHEFLDGQGMSVYLPEDQVLLEHFQNPATNRGQYLTGLAYELFENPDNDRNSHYFARELMYTGRHYYSAIREFGRHISMKKWEAERAQSMTFIGDCCLRLGHEQDAVEWWLKSIAADGSRREPYVKLAEFYFQRADPHRTASFASAAVHLPEVSYYANDMRHYRDYPHMMLYWALHNLGDMERAAEHWQKCLEFEPLNEKYLHDAQFYLPPEQREALLKATQSAKEAWDKKQAK